MMEPPVIEIANLHFRYSDGHYAVRGVTLRVNEGESVGLIGPNGAGKSTLLLHLNGILPERHESPSGITICGVPLTENNIYDFRQKVGVLFQDPDDQLFCPTVYEDVAFGPQQFAASGDEIHRRVNEALEMVNLMGYEKRSPHHLSAGEKQRVCLAGILACKPRILALDEPTRGLDPRGKRKLQSILQNIHATKIIATHDLELVVELCERVIVMDEGAIIADGLTRQILSNESLMVAHGLEKPHILRHQHPH